MASKKMRTQKKVRDSPLPYSTGTMACLYQQWLRQMSWCGSQTTAWRWYNCSAQLCTGVRESFALQSLVSHPMCEACRPAVWLCAFLWGAKILMLKSTGVVNFHQEQWDKFYTASCPRAVCSCWCSPQTPPPALSPCSVSHFYPCHSWSPILSILKPSGESELFSMAHSYCTS